VIGIDLDPVSVGALGQYGGKYWLRGLARRLADPANPRSRRCFRRWC
jgi:hypothetical protein